MLSNTATMIKSHFATGIQDNLARGQSLRTALNNRPNHFSLFGFEQNFSLLLSLLKGV